MVIAKLFEVLSDDRESFRGEFEFAFPPRVDERIKIQGAGPWVDVLLVVAIDHHPVSTDRRLIRFNDPYFDVRARSIGEEGDDDI